MENNRINEHMGTDTQAADKQKAEIKSPVADIICGDSKKMADKTKPTKKQTDNVVTKIFRRMSPTKKQYNEMNPSSSSKENTASKSCQTTLSAYTYTSDGLASSHSSSPSYPSTPTFSLTPAPSYQTIDQSPRNSEQQLLGRLHSTFSEATNIIEQYMLVRDRYK
ncbi:orph-D7 [Microplitis demolitor]|nr:orph-D7 [Microplitis demolitor]